MTTLTIVQAKTLPELEAAANIQLAAGAYNDGNLIVIPEHHIFGPGPTFALLFTKHTTESQAVPIPADPIAIPSIASAPSLDIQTPSIATAANLGIDTSTPVVPPANAPAPEPQPEPAPVS